VRVLGRTRKKEQDRLMALLNLDVLDRQADAIFSEVTKAAAYAFQTKIALVSLVDENRQWFLAREGLEAHQTSREISFCDHAVLQRCPLIVLDARRDSRFMKKPLVVGQPHIRFYAGAPIYVTGQAIGTLCVIDDTPRYRFDEADARALTAFARLAEDRFVLQHLSEAA
jgi:GAF domain-containing protein